MVGPRRLCCSAWRWCCRLSRGIENVKQFMPQTLPAKLRSWADVALSFVYPDVCQLCGANRATQREGYVCADCRAQVHFIEAPFCERCGLPFEGEITGAFECTNCREMELHFASARSAVV